MSRLRSFVNGQQMERFVNKPICLLAQVKEVFPDKMSLEVLTMDNETKQVTLSRPIDHPLSGYIHINGVYNGVSIAASNIVPLGDHEDVDTTAHNTLIGLLYKIPEVFAVM